MKLKTLVLLLVAVAAGAFANGALAEKKPPKKKGTALVCAAKANVHVSGTIYETDEDEILVYVHESEKMPALEGREIAFAIEKSTKISRDEEKADVDELMEDDDVEVDARTCKREGFSKQKFIATKVAATSAPEESEESEEEEEDEEDYEE